jgi:hypothetical protein
MALGKRLARLVAALSLILAAAQLPQSKAPAEISSIAAWLMRR